MGAMLQVIGKYRLIHHRQGKVLAVREGNNLVVTAGLRLAAQRLGNVGAVAELGWAAMGTSSTAPAVAQTALVGTEVERKACTVTEASAVLRMTCTFGAAIVASTVIQEFGTFNAAAAGTMFSRFIVNPLTFDVGDDLDFDWTVEFA